jgi:hypothetical protein
MVNISTGWADGSGVQGTTQGVHSNNVETQNVNGGQGPNQSTKEEDFERQVLQAVEIRVREGNSWRNKVLTFRQRLQYIDN